MGILNTTPDSFSDGGKFHQLEAGLKQARLMVSQGSDIIDIGGESTRPGSVTISAEEEIQRTVPLIKALRQEWNGLISIDTSKASVAKAALEAGANIVNDVTALEGDASILEVAKDFSAGLILMHMQGTPQTMQNAPHYTHGIVTYMTTSIRGLSSGR